MQSFYYLLELHPHQSNTFDIIVPVTSQGVQLLCGIVDNVEALVDEWFPGLRDLNVVGGAELIVSMSLCPLCPCEYLRRVNLAVLVTIKYTALCHYHMSE